MRYARLLLFLAAVPAFPADQWVRLTTPHFELYTTAGEKKGREVVLYFEQVRSFFTQSAPVKGGVTEFPVRIIVFKSEKQYLPYRASEVAFAYYARGQYRDHIVMQEADEEHMPATIHEYMHLVVSHSGLNLPPWLNEGWADVYSTLKPIGAKTMIGDLIPGRVQDLSTEKWMSFEALTSVDAHSPAYNEKKRAGIFYAESWALVHMLYLSPEYKTKFAPFVSAILQGKNAAEACQTVYGVPASKVYADLQAYLHRNMLYGAAFQVKLTKSESEAEMAPVDESEAALMLADVLAAAGKKEAQAVYEKLAAANPGKPEIERSLGYLVWQHGDRTAARGHFEKAFAAGDKDPQMCFHLAVLEREAQAPDEKIIPPLQRALLSRSDYTDARLQLGFVQMNAHNYDAALASFVQLHSISSEQAASVFNAMAYAYLQKGDLAQARKQAISARKWDKTEAETRQTDELIRFLDLEETAGRPAPAPPTIEAASLSAPSESSKDESSAPVLKRREVPLTRTSNPFVQPGEKIERVGRRGVQSGLRERRCPVPRQSRR